MSLSKALSELRTVAHCFEDRVIPALELTVAQLVRGTNADLEPIVGRLTAERTVIVDLVNRIMDHVAAENAELEIANIRELEIEASLRLPQVKVGLLTEFIDLHLHECPGRLLLFSEFYRRFQDWLPVGQQSD